MQLVMKKVLQSIKIINKRLTKLNCVDFGDLLLLPLKILQNNVDLLNRYQSLFSIF